MEKSKRLVVLLCFHLLLVDVDTLQYTKVPFGTVVTADGEARTYSNEFEIVIVRSHPKVIRSEYTAKMHTSLFELLRSLQAKGADETLISVYKRRLLNLGQVHERTRRWAVLEPVGELAGSIFGLTTNRETQEIRDRLNQVIASFGEQNHVIRGLTVALNDTIHVQTAIQSTVRTLMDRSRNVQEIISKIHSKLGKIEKQLALSSSYMMIETILSLLEFLKTQEDNYETSFRLVREFAEVGHVTENLVSEPKLRMILREINSPLPTSYIYKNFPVRLLTLTSSEVGYIFTIPKVDPEVYSAWRVMTVPFLNNAGILRLQPELSAVALGHTSGSMINTENCIFSGPKLCPNALTYRALPCLQGILAKSASLIQSCSVIPVEVSTPVVIKVSETQLLVSGSQDSVSERCLGRPASTYTLPSDSVLVDIPHNCTVSSQTYSWSYALGRKSMITLRIEDEFLLKGVEVNLTLPIAPSLPPLDWTHLQELSNITRHQLPQLNSLFDVPLLSVHKFQLMWILLVIGILSVGVGGMIFFKYRDSLCRKSQAKGWVGPHATRYRDSDASADANTSTSANTNASTSANINVDTTSEDLASQTSPPTRRELYPRLVFTP